VRGRWPAERRVMTRGKANAWMDRVAHDLRGPLAPMQTAVYLLREGMIADDQREELLAVLDRQIQRLSGMIGEFSDFGRSETRRLVSRRDLIDVEQLLADLVGRLHDRAPRLSIAAEVRGLQIQGDILRVAQLFETLLGIQLSRGRRVPVQARVERVDGQLRMTCALHCGGASDALAKALLSAPHPDPPDDTLGFGLLIASAIAEAHGGELRGRAGAPDIVELTLELPCAADAPATAGPQA